MADYWVKAGGDGTHGASYDPTSDSWASAHPTVDSAMTAGATAGDTVYISHLHSENFAADAAWKTGTSYAGFMHFISVNDTTPTTYTKGATFTFNDNIDWRQNNWCFFMAGLHFDGVTYFFAGGELRMYECDITYRSGGTAYIARGGRFIHLIDCNLDYPQATGSSYSWLGDCDVLMEGGSVTCTASPTYWNLHQGGQMTFIGVDFSAAPIDQLMYALNATEGTDRYYRCRLNAATALYNTFSTSDGANGELIVTNTASSSAAAEYQYAHYAGSIFAEDSTAYYRTGSVAFPVSNQKISFRVDTASGVGSANVGRVNIPTRFAELSQTASDAIVLHLISTDATLTDADIWARVTHSDGTNNHVPVQVESVTDAFKPLRSSSSLASSTEAWNDETGMTKYQLTVQTSGGMDGSPEIALYVAKPSLTFYICPQPELA